MLFRSCIAGLPDVVQGHIRAASACLASLYLAVPGTADWEAGDGMLPQKLAESDGDVNLPEGTGDKQGVMAEAKNTFNPRDVGGEEGVRFGARYRVGYGAINNGRSEEGQKLVIKDRAVVDPTRGRGDGGDIQGGSVGEKAGLGQEVNLVIHIVVSMRTSP